MTEQNRAELDRNVKRIRVYDVQYNIKWQESIDVMRRERKESQMVKWSEVKWSRVKQSMRYERDLNKMHLHVFPYAQHTQHSRPLALEEGSDVALDALARPHIPYNVKR